jgi:hypothetical protein
MKTCSFCRQPNLPDDSRDHACRDCRQVMDAHEKARSALLGAALALYEERKTPSQDVFLRILYERAGEMLAARSAWEKVFFSTVEDPGW